MVEPDEGKPHVRFFGGALETGQPERPLRVPGRCAEKRHHDGLVGTQPPDQPLPRQRSTRPHRDEVGV
ncbi:MAG: hypothetical protein ACREMZ_16995, partial [Gemmatimonadales bacterium]